MCAHCVNLFGSMMSIFATIVAEPLNKKRLEVNEKERDRKKQPRAKLMYKW